MEIRIAVDAEALIDALDDAIARAEDMRDTLPAEFSAWQEQDMNRRRADTHAPDPDTVLTMITTRPRPPVIPRGRRPGAPIIRRRRPGPPRPILRPELFDALRERMRALLGKTFAPWD